MGKDSRRVLVRGFVYTSNCKKVPIELEITDPVAISKLKVGMVGDFEICSFELGRKAEDD